MKKVYLVTSNGEIFGIYKNKELAELESTQLCAEAGTAGKGPSNVIIHIIELNKRYLFPYDKKEYIKEESKIDKYEITEEELKVRNRRWFIESPEAGSSYYCDKCNSWYKSTDIKKLDYTKLDSWGKPACPKCGFWQPDDSIKFGLWKIDEDIAPLIKWLNDKKYKTEFCCSGHTLDKRYESKKDAIKNKYIIGHPYIYFNENSKSNKKTKKFAQWVNENRDFLMSKYKVYIDPDLCIFRELYKIDDNYKNVDSLLNYDVHINRLKSLISFMEGVKKVILFYEEIIK